MKCPRCDTVQGKKYGATCQGCGWTYVFYPPTKSISDMKMKLRIASLTRGGTYAFTSRQLESLWIRQQVRNASGKSGPVGFIATLIVATVFSVFCSGCLGINPILIIAIAIPVGIGVLYVTRKFRPMPEACPEVPAWLSRWKAASPQPLLVEGPALSDPPAMSEDRQYDHGVERMLIVDRDELVDMFVKSGYHATNRCLVVSMSGYPSYLQDRAQQVIDETTRPVYLLHGTRMTGDEMVESSTFELSRSRVTDLGLTWAMVARHAGLRQVVEAGAVEVEVDHLLPMELMGAVGLCMDRNAPLSAVTDETARPEDDYGMFLLVDAFG